MPTCTGFGRRGKNADLYRKKERKKRVGVGSGENTDPYRVCWFAGRGENANLYKVGGGGGQRER